jgi:hypothetical protein
MKKFLDDYLIPAIAFAALCILLCSQSRANAPITEALNLALYDCRLTGDYQHMECATAIIQSADGSLRINPVTVGTERTFKLHLNLALGERVVCLFHTHPGRDPNADLFSDLDVRVAEKLGIPSYIYVLRAQHIRVYYPTRKTLVSINLSTPGERYD